MASRSTEEVAMDEKALFLSFWEKEAPADPQGAVAHP